MCSCKTHYVMCSCKIPYIMYLDKIPYIMCSCVFQVPPCPSCGGNLKPEITFFGDNVPKPTVEFVHRRVEECDALLMAGTSLQVQSVNSCRVLAKA